MMLIQFCLEHLAVFETQNRTNIMRHQNSVLHGLLKHVSWGVFDRLVAEHGSDAKARSLTSKSHLIAMLYGQLSGALRLREIETGLKSHAGQLYHLGSDTVARSTLAEANAHRPAAVFSDLFAALVGQLQSGYRRKIGDAVRLIDSTSLRLSGLSGGWASFSAGVCGAKAHIIYDPDADRPLYVAVTAANVNDITAAKEMPIEAGATYVFDLGYYDYGWWARLHEAGCRIVTRFRASTPFASVEERVVPQGSSILSDRIGHLPKRLAASRKNPMSDLVREVRLRIDTGKILRIFTNDLNADAQEITDLYKRRWAIELFFRWVKQTLKIRHFLGTSENAVRIQVAVALIAFLLLRAAQDVGAIVKSPLAFARLVRANLMHRRPINALLSQQSPPEQRQITFNFHLNHTKMAIAK